MLEKELEERLIKQVMDKGGVAYKFVSPAHRGVPDRILLFPGAKIGFVEVKRPGLGRLTKLQEFEIERLRAMDFPVFVLSDPEQIPEIISEVLSGI